MTGIVVYSPKNSTRLQYILQWLLHEQLGTTYELVHDEEQLKGLPFFISYGKVLPNALCIPDSGLLWEHDVHEQNIPTGAWQDIPTLYANNEAGYTLPFDLLSAIFFLITRYEEYYHYTPDKYGRYPATESILYRNGWLRRPIIDEWLQQLRHVLKEQYDVATTATYFAYQPTYDIDIAYSFRYKGWKRALGGFAKDLTAAQLKGLKDRALVVGGLAKDPYDSFDWLQELHNQYGISPIYFILAALRTTQYDKNILPSQPRMQELIRSLSAQGTVGVHPSFYSDQGGMLNEKKILENITGKDITLSRQHYIKMQLPHTYERLLGDRIEADYTMGYGTHLGFRAATGRSFLWYHLGKEDKTALRVYPFCFMDTSAMYYEKLSRDEAFMVLSEMTETLKRTSSILVTIFHNFSLGSSSEWAGWREAYAQFLKSFSELSLQVAV